MQFFNNANLGCLFGKAAISKRIKLESCAWSEIADPKIRFLALVQFLDAFLHLYKRVYPSVSWSVTHKLKSCKSAVFDQNYWQSERERIICRCFNCIEFDSHHQAGQVWKYFLAR